jgi:N-acetylglucosaminyl-diphospho-decaprenol L-rhamnosyltransferase
MRLLVVIVNYRTADLTVDCLRSLEGEVASIDGLRVVVVDNASGDGSAARLADAVRENRWGEWASILPLECNGGFAAGNNAAIRPVIESGSAPPYILLLNPDTVVRPGAVRILLDFMESRPDVGLAGSRLEHPDGVPQQSAFCFPSVFGELEAGFRLGVVSRILSRWVVAPKDTGPASPTDWVAGASLMIRREVFEAVGLLDEGYFLYYEEVDFCRRASRAGWPCWYVPESRVVHLIGQSTGVSHSDDAARRRRPAYWFEARRRYFLNHLGRSRTFLADLAWSAGYATYQARAALQGKPRNDPDRFLRDFLRYNFPLRPFMVKR